MTILPVAPAALALAALTLGAWVALAIAALFDRYAIPRLEDVAPTGPDDPPLPRLSIIVTAHNEERSMERALRSLLALRYPDYEVVYVNDRSTDRTGEIAERLSDGDARLTVLHIDELPPGWFGKPHASPARCGRSHWRSPALHRRRRDLCPRCRGLRRATPRPTATRSSDRGPPTHPHRHHAAGLHDCIPPPGRGQAAALEGAGSTEFRLLRSRLLHDHARRLLPRCRGTRTAASTGYRTARSLACSLLSAPSSTGWSP